MIIIVRLLYILLFIYFILYNLRLILSMLKITNNRVTELLCMITDPVINFFDRFLPLKIGRYRLSSLVPVVIMFFLLKFLSDMANQQYNLNINYLFYFLIYIADTMFVMASIMLFILTLVLFISRTNRIFANSFLVTLAGAVINPVINYMKRHFHFSFIRKESGYFILLLVLILVIGLIGHGILKHFYFYFESLLKDFSNSSSDAI